MEENLVKKLLQIPQRENAGARASNRFTYQQVWAFDYMLKVIDSNLDFILFMEFHDDIIVIDRTTNEQVVDFYQIKTDAKDSKYITTSFVTRHANKYPDKMSIMQKLIDEYVKFSNETRGLHLVSNKSFDFGKLNDTTESKTRSRVVLNEICGKELLKIKDGMCGACNRQTFCKEECVTLIYFDVADLALCTYEDTVMGRLVLKMDKMGISSTIERTRTVFNTILGEIRRINNAEKAPCNIEELLKKKSISKENFLSWMNNLRIEMPDELWNRIQMYLLSDGFKPLEIAKIYKSWKKYRIDSMNVETLSLAKLSEKISKIINETEKVFVNSKDYIEYIYNKIKTESNAKIYNKEYIYSIIIKEIFS